MASISLSVPLPLYAPTSGPSLRSREGLSSQIVRRRQADVFCFLPTPPPPYTSRSILMIPSKRRSLQIVRMAPEEEKLTRRSPLDFPIEWERQKPGRRPDIFPQFSPMKTPLPPPLPADPPEEDEEEDEEKKEEEEEDPEKEKEEDPDKPDKPDQ